MRCALGAPPAAHGWLNAQLRRACLLMAWIELYTVHVPAVVSAQSPITADYYTYGIHPEGGLWKMRCFYCDRVFIHLYPSALLVIFVNHLAQHYKKDPDARAAIDYILIQLNKTMEAIRANKATAMAMESAGVGFSPGQTA
jgi:hypothetical protein